MGRAIPLCCGWAEGTGALLAQRGARAGAYLLVLLARQLGALQLARRDHAARVRGGAAPPLLRRGARPGVHAERPQHAADARRGRGPRRRGLAERRPRHAVGRQRAGARRGGAAVGVAQHGYER
jgi:hypothetical protein